MKWRYVFFTIFELLQLLSIIVGNYFNILQAALLAYILYLTNKIEKNSLVDGPLTKNEKIQVILTIILNPIIAGGFYYYCWRNKLPIKAKQANKYSIIIFILWLIIGVPLYITFFRSE